MLPCPEARQAWRNVRGMRNKYTNEFGEQSYQLGRRKASLAPRWRPISSRLRFFIYPKGFSHRGALSNRAFRVQEMLDGESACNHWVIFLYGPRGGPAAGMIFLPLAVPSATVAWSRAWKPGEPLARRKRSSLSAKAGLAPRDRHRLLGYPDLSRPMLARAQKMPLCKMISTAPKDQQGGKEKRERGPLKRWPCSRPQPPA